MSFISAFKWECAHFSESLHWKLSKVLGKIERSESEFIESTDKFWAVFRVSCVFPEGGYEVIVSEFPFGIDKQWHGHRREWDTALE